MNLLLEGPLLAWQKKWQKRSETLGFPGPKTDGFEYISFGDWKDKHYEDIQSVNATPTPLPECSSSYITFVNGSFRPDLSQIPSSLVAIPLSLAMKSYGLFLQNRLQRLFKEETDFFALLNGARHGEGLFLYVPPGITFSSPLQILHLSTPKSFSCPRIHLAMGKQSSLEIIHSSPSESGHTFIDMSLDDSARCSFYDLSTPSHSSRQTQSFRASLKQNSYLRTFHFTSGAETVRTSLKIDLAEENSEALVQNLSLLSQKNESHFHTRIEHQAPHCRSRQQIKTILQHHSRSSFEGKIYVHPVAQKTEAYQHSQTLLLSPSAASFAKPNLEIFADDVKASHGCTISKPNPESLFYLRSRGLPEAEAQSLLIQGFYQELLQSVPEFIHREILSRGAVSCR